jgi:hypothetical protein
VKKRDLQHMRLQPKGPKPGVPILIELYRMETDPNPANAQMVAGSGIVQLAQVRSRKSIDATRIVGVSEHPFPGPGIPSCVEIRLTAGGSQFVDNPYEEVVAAWASAVEAGRIDMDAVHRQMNPNGHDGEDLEGRGPPDYTPPHPDAEGVEASEREETAS